MKEPPHIKSRFERFMEEYTAIEVPADNKRGFKVEYVYYGIWFIWDLPADRLKKKKTEVFLACITGVLATIVVACIPNWLNAMLFVAIPAILGLLTCFLQTVSVGRFLFSKNPTSRSNYRAIAISLRVFPILNAALSVMTIIGCMGYMISLRVYDMQSIMIPFLHLTEAASSAAIGKIYHGISFRTESNDVLKEVKRLSPNS